MGRAARLCVTHSFVINPISRFGYVGDGRKAMLTLKDKVFDALMLRRTKVGAHSLTAGDIGNGSEYCNSGKSTQIVMHRSNTCCVVNHFLPRCVYVCMSRAHRTPCTRARALCWQAECATEVLLPPLRIEIRANELNERGACVRDSHAFVRAYVTRVRVVKWRLRRARLLRLHLQAVALALRRLRGPGCGTARTLARTRCVAMRCTAIRCKALQCNVPRDVALRCGAVV